MNLRTFTPSRMFFLIFFSAQLLVVMFDTGKAVDLTCHQHELEQIAFYFGDQCRDTFDHLTGQVLIVLSQQNVVEVAGDLAAALLATFQETVDTVHQLAKLRRSHFTAQEALPVGAQIAGFVTQLVEDRGALLDQIHGPVRRALGQLDHIGQALGRIGDLRDFLGLRHLRIDLETDDRAVQLTR
ncbi:hypothetical protein D9M71_540610 [compost metagenome]